MSLLFAPEGLVEFSGNHQVAIECVGRSDEQVVVGELEIKYGLKI